MRPSDLRRVWSKVNGENQVKTGNVFPIINRHLQSTGFQEFSAMYYSITNVHSKAILGMHIPDL